MRNLSSHITSLDRQVQESVKILEKMKKEGQCLNLKSKWRGSKNSRLGSKISQRTSSAQERRRRERRQEGVWRKFRRASSR